MFLLALLVILALLVVLVILARFALFALLVFFALLALLVRVRALIRAGVRTRVRIRRAGVRTRALDVGQGEHIVRLVRLLLQAPDLPFENGAAGVRPRDGLALHEDLDAIHRSHDYIFPYVLVFRQGLDAGLVEAAVGPNIKREVLPPS